MRLASIASIALLVLASTSVVGAAFADEPVTADNNDWWRRYRDARKKMEDGQFAAAAEELEALSASAPDAVTAAFVRDDARLCRSWATRNLVLAPKNEIGGTERARAANERTIDELAVLYTNAVFYGVGTGGWIAVLTEPDSAAGVVLPMLGLAGLSAAGVFALDSGKPLGYGVPQSIVSGMYIGLAQGVAWTVWNQSRYRYYESWSDEAVATAIWGAATLGGIAGGVIGTARGTTPGRASYVSSAALWSGAVAGLVTYGFAPDNASHDDRTWLGVALGLNAGAVVGAVTAGDVSPSIARVRFLDLGGIAGALVGGGLALAIESDSERVLPLMTAGGVALGLGVAWAATTRMSRDTSAIARAMPAMAIAPARGGAMLTLGLPL